MRIGRNLQIARVPQIQYLFCASFSVVAGAVYAAQCSYLLSHMILIKARTTSLIYFLNKMNIYSITKRFHTTNLCVLCTQTHSVYRVVGYCRSAIQTVVCKCRHCLESMARFYYYFNINNAKIKFSL